MSGFFKKLVDKLFRNPRRESIIHLAESHNWGYTQQLRRDEQDVLFQGFRIFRLHKTLHLKDSLEVPASLVSGHFRVFDCIRRTDKAQIRTTVFVYCGPEEISMHPFFIRPRNFFHAIGRAFVRSEPLFETTHKFNALYLARTSNIKATRLDLNEEMLGLLAEESGWRLEGNRNYLIGYKYGRLLPPERYVYQLDRFERICERLVNGISGAEYV